MEPTTQKESPSTVAVSRQQVEGYFFCLYARIVPPLFLGIGEYTLDRNGVLTGARNSQLMLTLDQDGYRTK